MKIATWNVNSLSVRLPQVLEWLAANPVDALGLQELKLTDDKFPHMAFQEAGYTAVSHGQKTYNGVAWITRETGRDVVRNIPGLDDEQARIIATTIDSPAGEVRLINGYFVNGQEPGSEKFAYKMRWLQALQDWVKEQMALHPRLVLVGDFNVAPEDRDSYDPVGLKDTIHHTVQERDHFQRLLQLGLSDAFRMFEQPEKATPGGTTACWAFRRIAACASTIFWSAKRSGARSAPAAWTALRARTSSPATMLQ